MKERPLHGRRIVITRARSQAEAFARALEELGGEVVEFPTIETVAPDSYGAIDGAIARLGEFDWIVFTSARGVDAFIARMRAQGRDIRDASRASIAAIGPATASRVEHYALLIAAMPSEYRAEAVLPAIGKSQIAGKRFLIARAQEAREVLPEMLRAEGATEVVVAPVYKTIAPAGAAIDRIRDLLSAQPYDLVAFTSSSTVTNFCALMGRPGDGVKAAVIGPITEQTAREYGFSVVVRPEKFTIPALLAAIRSYFSLQPQP